MELSQTTGACRATKRIFKAPTFCPFKRFKCLLNIFALFHWLPYARRNAGKNNFIIVAKRRIKRFFLPMANIRCFESPHCRDAGCREIFVFTALKCPSFNGVLRHWKFHFALAWSSCLRCEFSPRHAGTVFITTTRQQFFPSHFSTNASPAVWSSINLLDTYLP